MPDPYLVFPGVFAVIAGGLVMWGIGALYVRWQEENARKSRAKRCGVTGASSDGWRRVCTLPVAHEAEHFDQRAPDSQVNWVD